MQLIRLLIFVTFSFSIANCVAQVSKDETEKLNKIIQKSIKTNAFPDSTALYTCQIQITIDVKKHYKPTIFSTDTALANKLNIMEILENYNYRPLMLNQKTIRLIIPVAITTIGFKDRPNASINADSVGRRVYKLFYRAHNNESINIVYLQPIMFSVVNVKWH